MHTTVTMFSRSIKKVLICTLTGVTLTPTLLLYFR